MYFGRVLHLKYYILKYSERNTKVGPTNFETKQSVKDLSIKLTKLTVSSFLTIAYYIKPAKLVSKCVGK